MFRHRSDPTVELNRYVRRLVEEIEAAGVELQLAAARKAAADSLQQEVVEQLNEEVNDSARQGD